MAVTPIRSRRSVALGLFAAALFSGCSDTNGPQPVIPVTRTITVNAASAFTFVALDTIATNPAVADAATSTDWDIGLYATTVMLNGGEAGPGGVTGHCLCQYASLSNTEIAALTAASTLGTFDSVTTADIPAATAFTSDALAPAIAGWVDNPGTGATPASGRSWIIREGTSSVVLAKFHVTNIQNPTATSAGTVTVEYAVQPSAGAAFGSVQTAQIAMGAGPVYVDLTTGAVTTAANWDLRFDGYTIRVNGGVSGTGSVKAVLDTSTPFASIDATYAASAPAVAYSADRYTGVFGTSPWYRYNITGTDNQIWPVYNVYLVQRGTQVFKVQLVGYYGTDGTPRQITVRYAKLAN